ncbi:MAG: hypothetical protein AAF414_17180 [Pseudomonadota bacterium]
MSTNVLPTLIKPPVSAGLTVNNVVYGSPSSGSSVSLSLSGQTSGRLLGVFVSNEDAFFSPDYTASLTIGGVGATEVTGARARASRFFADQFSHQFFWLVDETSVGSTTFTVSMSPDQWQIVCFEIVGANNASPIGAVQPSTSTASNCEFSLTTTEANSLALSGSHGRATPFSVASGLTERVNDNPTSNFFAVGASRACPTVGGYTMGGTASGTVTCASSAVEILAA